MGIKQVVMSCLVLAAGLGANASYAGVDISVGVRLPGARIDVDAAPPPIRYEPVPPPRPGYIWQSGFWRWDDGRYLWMPGTWVVVRSGYTWVPERWEPRGPRWHFEPGRWEPHYARPVEEHWHRAPPPPRYEYRDNRREWEHREWERRRQWEERRAHEWRHDDRREHRDRDRWDHHR